MAASSLTQHDPTTVFSFKTRHQYKVYINVVYSTYTGTYNVDTLRSTKLVWMIGVSALHKNVFISGMGRINCQTFYSDAVEAHSCFDEFLSKAQLLMKTQMQDILT